MPSLRKGLAGAAAERLPVGMARLRLDFPGPASFATELPVRIDDVNFAGHLGHDSLLTLLHEARARYFQSLGWNELDFGADGGTSRIGIILADVAIQYRSEAHYGDRLRVEIHAADAEEMRCDLLYRVSCINVPQTEAAPAGSDDAPAGREVARAKTGLAFFDYSARKAVPLPPAVRSKLQL